MDDYLNLIFLFDIVVSDIHFPNCISYLVGFAADTSIVFGVNSF